jgi:hypothetical protein
MKQFWIAALTATLFLGIQADAFGQRSSDTDRYLDESEGFSHHLWYGGGFALDFYRNRRGDYRLFTVGIIPLVGYKITEELSIGPRFSLLYNHYRQDIGFGRVATANMLDYGVGVFTRYKVLRNFFIHLEYGLDSEEVPTPFLLADNKWETARQVRNNGFVGIGYNNSAGLLGYDIYLLYNGLLDKNSIRQPIDMRVGITYNF